jgi:pimeloyl-ACP methyl ester carboxylesterase
MSCYDETALLHENASEAGLPWSGPAALERREVDGVSTLVWGMADPQLVLLHGGAQNAHTWDTVALALGRALIAVDQPGHGHSAWREDLDYSPHSMAKSVALAVERLAPRAAAVVGTSMGGITSIALAAHRPDLVRRLVLVDVTPGPHSGRAVASIHAFVGGPESFASFDEILKRTIEFNPTRTESSLRRGVTHNAKQLPDDTWTWRYDRRRREGAATDFTELWDELASVRVPVMLLRGVRSDVVSDEHVARLRAMHPDARVETVEGSGHSIQGDRPLELARLVSEFVFG